MNISNVPNVIVQELKSAGHHLAVFKPSPVHWARFAQSVIKLRLFDDFIELGASQALWQFSNTLAVIPNNGSSRAAKENAVVSLIYINVTRMILAQMLGPNSKEILPEEFLNKLAKIQSDEDMDKLVKAEFLPMVKIPSLMDKVNMDWLKLIRSREPMEQIQKYLLKNVRKFCEKTFI